MTPTRDADLDALTSLSRHLSLALGPIEDQQWASPTPCAGWDLQALVDHVTGGNWFTKGILAGHSAEDAMATTMERFAGRSATRDEAAASVDEQRTAFRQFGVLDRTWDQVAGTLTGRQILRLRIHDLIVHTWDIEHTLNPPASLPSDLVRWGIEELADGESLTAEHFDLAIVAVAQPSEPPGDAYLRSFGRRSDDA